MSTPARTTTRFPGGLVRVSEKGITERLDGAKSSRIEAFCGSFLKGFTKRHPCIGARSVSENGNLYFGVYEQMQGVESAWRALRDLEAYYAVTDPIADVTKTFAMVFVGTPVTDAADFAQKYWEFAQTMHDIDMLSHHYDPTVSSDVTAQNFEFSLAGRAVFTTTLNPAHPRAARRSNYPIWVCNQKSQFDQLRASGQFQRWHDSISQHDAQLDPSGMANPMLADHGYASAADQLPGWALRPVPFRARTTASMIEEAYRELRLRAVAEGAPSEIIGDLDSRAAKKFGPNWKP